MKNIILIGIIILLASCAKDGPVQVVPEKIILENIPSKNHPDDLIPLDSGNVWIYRYSQKNFITGTYYSTLDTMKIIESKVRTWRIGSYPGLEDYPKLMTYRFKRTLAWPHLGDRLAKVDSRWFFYGCGDIDMYGNFVNEESGFVCRLDPVSFLDSGLTVTTPVGTFKNCLKYVTHFDYCPGVGLVSIVDEYKNDSTNEWDVISLELIGYTVK